MSRIIDAILGLSGTAAYGLVGLLAFGEAAAFIGLLLPGEIAVLLGGVIAAAGHASLPVMIVVASVAAIAGDSVGYEIGRRYGTRILAWPPFARRFSDKVATASIYLEEKGGRAVFLGRWTSLLRALVPGLAGMARMPYRKFLVANVIGGVAWATTFVLLGYAAGTSWRTVERIAGQASLLLLVLLVLGVLIRWATGWLGDHADLVHARLDALAATPPLAWIRRRFSGPLQWVRDRATPGASRGLGYTFSFLLVGGAAWLVGIAVQDLFAREELALLDGPVASWVAQHSTPTARSVAVVIVDGLGAPFGIWCIALLAGLAWRARDRAAGIRVVIAAPLALSLALVLHRLLPVSDAGTRFPDVTVAWLVAALVAALPAIASRDLVRAIEFAGAGVAVVTLAAAAVLVSGESALSGIVGAIGVGGLIGAAGDLTWRTVTRDTVEDLSVLAEAEAG